MSDSHPLSLNRQLAQRAKTFCSNLGLTQSTLAKLLRVDDSQFSRFLRGESNLSSEKTLKLVRLMALSKRDLELKFGSPEKLTARLCTFKKGVSSWLRSFIFLPRMMVGCLDYRMRVVIQTVQPILLAATRTPPARLPMMMTPNSWRA